MFHSPDTLFINSNKAIAGVSTIHFNTLIILRRSSGTNRHKISIFVLYFHNKSANIKKNFFMFMSKNKIRPEAHMYNHTQIKKRRGGWFNYDHNVIFYPFFVFFDILYIFLNTFKTLLSLFFSLFCVRSWN